MCVAHKWHINYTHLGTDLIAALARLQVHYFPHIDCLIELDKGQVNLSRCVKAWSLTDSISTERVCLIHTSTHTHTHTDSTHGEGETRYGTLLQVRLLYVCCEWSARSRRESNVHWSRSRCQRLSDPPTQQWASRERETGGEGWWAGCVSISCALAFCVWERERARQSRRAK